MTVSDDGATYRLEVAAAPRRQLSRLTPAVAAALVEFISVVLVENPWRVSKALVGDFVPWRSARRGDYRVIFRVDEQSKTVLVGRIAHRSVVYRPPPP